MSYVADIKDEDLQRLLGNLKPGEIKLAPPIKTLRDEFALIAMPQCMADALENYGHMFPDLAARAARRAYECADAMMKAREQK